MPPRTGRAPVVRPLMTVALVAALATTAMLLLPAGQRAAAGPGVLAVAYQVGYYACAWACLLVVLIRAWAGGDQRLGWTLVGLGLAAYLLGDLAWATYVSRLHPEPFPSVADALYLLLYPLVFCGLVLLFRGQVGRTGVAVWLDGLIGGLGLGAVAARFALDPVLAIGHGRFSLVATNLAYPVGDLVLLSVATTMLAILRHHAGIRWLLLLGGLAVLAACDAGYLVTLTAGTYRSPSLLDQGWLAAFLLVACASQASPGRPHAGTVAPMATVPLVSAACATVVMVTSGPGSRPVATLLAAAAVGLTLVRLAVTIRETSALGHTHHQARTDELTGLPNRRAFYERIGQLAPAHAQAAPNHAVLLVDLDRFKEVNDSFGHQVGDSLLRLVGPRLAAQVGPGDLIARLGGDEFGILVLGDEPAEAVAERLCASLDRPFELRDLTVQISASVGVAHLASAVDPDSSTLLRRADVAMYAAKRARVGWRCYSPDEDPNSPERLHLLDALRTMLAAGGEQLELHYQPKIRLADDTIDGVEALVRWRHPTLGLLAPAEFLPLVEEYGLSRRLTDVVLHTALSQCGQWLGRGVRLPVAVNLPAALCTDPDLPDHVAALLTDLEVPPGLLELEITEEFMLTDRHRARTVLTRLGEQGVRVSIDDFGTGYSSLAYLRDLPIDQLKLDRTFVSAIEWDPTSAALVRSTVSLAHSLGLQMVAEGVESAGVLEHLRTVGCDQAQGFHLGRPLPATELEDWLSAREAAAVRSA